MILCYWQLLYSSQKLFVAIIQNPRLLMSESTNHTILGYLEESSSNHPVTKSLLTRKVINYTKIYEMSQLNNVNTATPAIHSIVVETYDFP